jgi:Protein of unknown function (DUF1566)
MRKERKTILLACVVTALLTAAFVLPGMIRAGSLEPSATPGSTMKTLDQIPPTWSQILPVSDRFELVMNDEAVLDKETGLVWAKDANILSAVYTQPNAVSECYNTMEIGNRKGWRVPTIEELGSLVDPTQNSPALPAGHPFVNVQNGIYWSGTTLVKWDFDTNDAWTLNMTNGAVASTDKQGSQYYVWPVRGGS